MQVLPEDASKPLRFNLYGYRKQVAAGTLKMAKNGDIIATVPSSEGPDYRASASSNGSSPASSEPDAGCVNRAGFNVCEEKVVKKMTPVKAAVATVKETVAPLTTDDKISLKTVKAGTCFNRAGFVVDCM